MAGDDQNSDNQLFGEHLDLPEVLEVQQFFSMHIFLEIDDTELVN